MMNWREYCCKIVDKFLLKARGSPGFAGGHCPPPPVVKEKLKFVRVPEDEEKNEVDPKNPLQDKP